MPQEETRTLELRDYLRVLGRHKWIIAITLVVCVGVALAASMTKAPEYRATGQVILKADLVERMLVPTANVGDQGSDRARTNEISIMSGPEVRKQVEDTLGRKPEYVTFTAVPFSDVVNITAVGGDPKDVAETVNAYADKYISVRTDQTVSELTQAAESLQKRIDALNVQINQLDADLLANPPAQPVVGANGRVISSPATDPRVTDLAKFEARRDAFQTKADDLNFSVTVAEQPGARVLARAVPPDSPENKNPTRNLLAGLALGIVLAIALAFLREYLDDTVKTKEDLESSSGMTVVGIIPAVPDWKKRETTPLVSVLQPRSSAAEAYRSVRTSVEFLGLDQPIGSIQVTSALASEGKTSTLANLAVTFARAGQRVIVLCCDLRRPRVHEFFGLSNRVGFTSVLLGDTPLGQAIQQADRDLPIGLVASGPLPPNPAELLASKRAVDVIEDLDRRCDLLLIDSPPVLPVTDSLVISGLVDGVLLVASAGSSTKRGTKRSVELLHQVDAPLIGAILNGVDSKLEYGYTYGGDNRYYLDTPDPRKAPAESRNGKTNGSGNGKRRAGSSTRAAR